MADEKLEKRAERVFEDLCKALDNNKIKYQKEGLDQDGDWTVRFSFGGDDLPMDFVMFVDTKRQLVRVMSMMPFTFSEAKRVEGAIVVGRANYKMVDGCFDYNVETGKIIFKITASYIDSILGDDAFMYMIHLAVNMVDEFNDKFFMVDKGMMSVDQFIEKY